MKQCLRYIFCFLTVVFATVSTGIAQSSFPIYVSVQVVPPAGIYLTDYYSGTRDRLVVTLINRDNEQTIANVKLRVSIRNSSIFELRSREELHYPMLTLESGVPLRLTSMDLQPYLAPDRVTMNGYLENGRLPNGMTEFRVQALDYTTGRTLSEVAVGRVWLESKQPPLLNQPTKGDLLSLRNPQHIRFGWMPRHQGLAQTVYEFVLKELPDKGVPPQTVFMYGPEIYRTETNRTTLDYGTMEPPLEPGKRYGWQVRAKTIDGVDEIGLFDNQGYSEICWFELSDNCPEVRDIRATAGFRKIDLTWRHHPDQNAFVVQWRPKTQSGTDWQSETVFENAHTIDRLQEGWTYEYRVGALCISDIPLFGRCGEVTLPEKNEERLKNCGKIPNIDLANQEPNENLQVGDMVTIGGDFPMRVDEVNSLGNGWYSGKGGLVFPWIFDIGINLEFSRLRVNTDNVQIDGEVETAYDEDESLIGNTNRLDSGGKDLTQGGVVFGASVEVDFTIPDMPQCEYNEETGSLVITDEHGDNPQTVQIPKNDGKSSFPMEIVDAEGNRYQIDMPQEESGDDVASGESETEGNKEKPRPTITKLEDVNGIINTKELSNDADFNIRFSGENSKYAFDDGREQWYQNSILLRDEFYKPFGANYIAPWKLVPVGLSDQVEAAITAGSSSVDRSKIKFVLADGTGVAAKDDGDKWTLTIPSTDKGKTYDIFAVYEKSKAKLLTVGKLRVVSYAKQRHTVTLVPVGVDTPNIGEIQKQLNAIYSPYGVEFTVNVDDAIRDLAEWQGRTFKLEGNGFFTRENADMSEIRKAYQSASGTSKDEYYVFVLGSADTSSEDSETQAHGAQGDMPRGTQFGYVFSNRTNDIGWLLAHELGHGVFTLKHLNDANYAGKSSLGSIRNLMDYTNSTNLVAFQWNVMSSPAIITGLDGDDASKAPKLTSGTQDINRFFNLYKCALSTKSKFDFPKIISNYGHSGTLVISGKNIEISLLIAKQPGLIDYTPIPNATYTLKTKDDAKKWMDFGAFAIYADEENHKLVYDYLNSLSFDNKTAIEKYWQDKDFKSLYQYDVCSFRTVSVDVRLAILSSLGSQHWNIDHEDHIAVTIIRSLLEDDNRGLYKWLREHPKEVLSLYSGIDDENTHERFLEYVMLCSYNYFESNSLVASSLKADRNYIFDKNKQYYLSFSDNNGTLAITETNAGVGNTKQHLDVNPMEPVKIQATNSAGSSNDKDYEMHIPAIYLRYLIEKANEEDVLQFVNGTVTIAGVYSGAGLLIRGGSTILKVIGAVELVNSATNVLLFSDAVQSQLKQTDYGRKFLELWPKISTATDVATLFTYLGVSKTALTRNNSIFTSAEKNAITKELTRAEKIIYDITKNSTEIKNIRAGSTDQFVLIGTDMNRIKDLVRRLEQEGHIIEVLDDAYLPPKRKFTIEGKQWTVDEAWQDMKNANMYLNWRDGDGFIKPEYIEQIPMGKLNRMWLEDAKNSGYTIIDIGNPKGYSSAFYDMELQIMNWK